MESPTPLFTTVPARPLAERLPAGAVIVQARLVAPHLVPEHDPRLGDAQAHAFHTINTGGFGFLTVEWPDGVLARLYLRGGMPVLTCVHDELVAAYERGRTVLEQIHARHALHAGIA